MLTLAVKSLILGATEAARTIDIAICFNASPAGKNFLLVPFEI